MYNHKQMQVYNMAKRTMVTKRCEPTRKSIFVHANKMLPNVSPIQGVKISRSQRCTRCILSWRGKHKTLKVCEDLEDASLEQLQVNAKSGITTDEIIEEQLKVAHGKQMTNIIPKHYVFCSLTSYLYTYSKTLPFLFTKILTAPNNLIH